MTNHYARGTKFEHDVRDLFRGLGYEVLRAAGSKGSSKVDLICWRPGALVFVQCKANGVLGAGEWNRVREVAGWVDAVPVWAVKVPGKAGAAGVQLWRLDEDKRVGSRLKPCILWDAATGRTVES